MRILLARHGETTWNVEGRHQGAMDIPLSEAGESQARALGARLAGCGLDRIVASPLQRARRTAELARGDRALEVATDPGLLEIRYGLWEGRLASEIRLEDGERQRAWREAPQTVTFPGGECLQEVLERAWPALHTAAQGLGETDTALVVAHDGVNRVLLCRILGLPLSRLWSFQQAPTCLNLLEGPDPSHLRVVRLNDATHLVDLFGEVVHRRI